MLYSTGKQQVSRQSSQGQHEGRVNEVLCGVSDRRGCEVELWGAREAKTRSAAETTRMRRCDDAGGCEERRVVDTERGDSRSATLSNAEIGYSSTAQSVG